MSCRMVQASELFYQIVDGAKHAKDVVDGHLQKVDPLVLVIGAIGGTVVYLKVSKLYAASDRPLHKRLAGYIFQQLRRLPSVKAKVDEELSGARKDIQHTVLKYEPEGVGAITAIPPNGMTDEQVLALASEYNDFGTFDVADGKVSGAVYTDRSDEHIKLLGKIYEQYAYSNPLHPDVFPGVRKMEAEVIRMVLNLYHAPEDSAGSLTTGGTESIIMACFAYRNMAMERGVESPVILCSETAHAAFDKAADLCGMRIRHVPVDENNRLQLKKMEQMISSDVCMLVGSAPNFPTGTVDPISDIAKLGEKYGIPVHVDACLGGFMIPFMNEAGFHLNTFDFRNPGVTSISCDTHKYGCTPKGSSVVMYRSKQLHHYQYFAVPEWTGGIYATPTICGSRAGANAAVAWATLCRFGRTEYVQRARAIVEQTRRLAEGVKKIEGLELHGSPDVSIVAFKSKDNVFNIYAVSDKLNKMGYNLNTLQNPDAVHVCLTYNHARPEVVDQLLVDIAGAVKEVLASEDKGHKSATAALYGMAAQIPDKTLVNEMAFEFLDACYVAKKN